MADRGIKVWKLEVDISSLNRIFSSAHISQKDRPCIMAHSDSLRRIVFRPQQGQQSRTGQKFLCTRYIRCLQLFAASVYSVRLVRGIYSRSHVASRVGAPKLQRRCNFLIGPRTARHLHRPPYQVRPGWAVEVWKCSSAN